MIVVVGGGRESPHLQRFSGAHQAGQLHLGHRGLTAVHEVDDTLSLPAADVFEHDDGVFARIFREDLGKIRATEEGSRVR